MMKNYYITGLITALVLVCCTGSTSSDENKQPYLQPKTIAKTDFGVIKKFKDGENTIYLYERSGGAGSITVITPCSK